MDDTYIDLNNVTSKRGDDVCGEVISHGIENDVLTIEGALFADESANWVAVATDKYRRFLACGTPSQTGEWSMNLPLAKLQNLPPDEPVAFYGLDKSSNELYGIRTPKDLSEAIGQYLRSNSDNSAPEIPSHQEHYIKEILNATKTSYISKSIEGNIKTGNNYQSIAFGDTMREGTRPTRHQFLDFINFEGRTVLDIGANTGEVSRTIRLLGADLVDGVEYDPFFVETGRMIHAAMGSLFQGDATHPGFYRGKSYDIVVALSVFVYIKRVLPQIAKATDVLVFETHTLDHGLGMYLDAVTPHFPAYRHLGFTEKNQNLSRSRAFLIFAKDAETLDENLQARHLKVAPYYRNPFLEKYGSTTPDEFIEFVGTLKDDVYTTDASADPFKFGSTDYFATYLVGYLEYKSMGDTVDESNIFSRRFEDAIKNKTIDPDLRSLLDDTALLLKKIQAKYEDIDHYLSGDLHRVPPVYLSLDPKGKMSFTDTENREYKCNNIDGHHRYFLAQLLAHQTLMFTTTRKEPEFETKIKSTYTLT